MKRMNLTNSQDLFDGNEERHRAANEAARQTLRNFLDDDQVIENFDNFWLAGLFSTVIHKLPGMDLPSVAAIVCELEEEPEFRDLVMKCFKDKDYKCIRNLCQFLYSVDLYCAHVTSQVGID